MKATELIRWALQMTGTGTARLVSDMKEHALAMSTPGANGGDGNHTLWLLGHMAFIEGSVLTILYGEPNPVGHWAHLFATGTTSSTEAAEYPSFDEVLTKYQQIRRETLSRLERSGESGLDAKPMAVPPGFEDVMTSVGQTLLLVTLHNMVHYGQIADARRVAGRPPLM